MKNGPYELIIAPAKYPGKRYRDRYAYEHHVVWWRSTGAVPPKGFEIHHINGDHRDNRIDNLALLTEKEHRTVHANLSRKPPIEFKCDFCGKVKEIFARDLRFRRKKNKNGVFCSRKCGGLKQASLKSYSLD